MATVTGLTSGRMQAIENASVVSGTVTGDDLILTTYGGTQINAGNVRGPQGEIGPEGPMGEVTQAELSAVNNSLQNQITSLVDEANGDKGIVGYVKREPIGNQTFISSGGTQDIQYLTRTFTAVAGHIYKVTANVSFTGASSHTGYFRITTVRDTSTALGEGLWNFPGVNYTYGIVGTVIWLGTMPAGSRTVTVRGYTSISTTYVTPESWLMIEDLGTL